MTTTDSRPATTALTGSLADWVFYDRHDHDMDPGREEYDVRVTASPGLTLIAIHRVTDDKHVMDLDPNAARGLAMLLGHVADVADPITGLVGER